MDTHATSTMNAMVHNMISGDGTVHLGEAVGEASKSMSYERAAIALVQRPGVPKEVTSLLQMNSTSGLTEESLTKARNFLNGLVESAYVELDAKIIDAKEFEGRNRGKWEQVVADISRLGGQIADHMRKSAEATSCISATAEQVDAVRAQRSSEYDEYHRQYLSTYAELTVKQNDLDVFDFLIKTTKGICDSAGGLLLGQVDRADSVEFCSSGDGESLRFNNDAMQRKFDKLLTKSSKDLLNNALMRMQTGLKPTSFLQTDEEQPAQAMPVKDGQDSDSGELKCGPISDCGLMYDTLSLEWGGYKDQVDELKKTMADNQAAWRSLQEDFDAQLTSLVSASDECVSQLAEATANKNADQQILDEKTDDKRLLDKEHKKTMREFHRRIRYIFNQDICGPIVIRNNMMSSSSDCKPSNIDDCDVTGWTPETCSVECDDSCPDQVGCGGNQRLTREVVSQPNACGIKCPKLAVTQKCNQVKCPVECMMSRWSGWSKCSKDCGGGVEERTRSVLRKPQNGGRGCTSVSDGRPCNTGSCDRDCTLEEWSSWSPCSMACGGGNQERVRKVDIPIRAGGKCPRPRSSHRLQRQGCNTFECIGDEICVAKQDLIVAVDGSGSMTAAHWSLVKNFTGELLKRYRANYYGTTTMKVGLILFGNGIIEEDGTVSKALVKSELTADLAAVREAAAALSHKAGFTNMAQSFVLAEKLLQQKGRREAQSAVLTISDGKPSFLFETTEKAKELEDRGIMKFMIGIAEFPGSGAWKLMQELATKPAFTNTVRVPGFDALEDGGGPFVRAAISKFCPDSMSPSATAEQDSVQGYMLVREEGYCGGLGRALSRKSYDSQNCFALAQEKGATGFSMGRRYRAGKCCVETLSFTCDDYKQWVANPDNPACSSSWGGGFHNSRYYDWYALEPADCATS